MTHRFHVPGFASAEEAVPPDLMAQAAAEPQRSIPAIAKDPRRTSDLAERARGTANEHRLSVGDARDLVELPDESVHLVLTSPPYWSLKRYEEAAGQLGHVEDYERFLEELAAAWGEVLRVLVPGGRMAVVVGDVCVPRRAFGRHVVFPLHASIQEQCRRLGFDNLNPIIWYRIANAQLEVDAPGGFLGKPYEPNAVIKNDIEFLLFQRKPGGYRRPSLAEKLLSLIPEADHRQWFRQIWELPGASTRDHPAPFPLPLAERLVRMFSFVGDTVLDPFCGTGTTNLAAARWGRNSVGIDVVPSYVAYAADRLEREAARLPELLGAA